MAALDYPELWTSFQADGGTRHRFLPLPVEAEDDMGVDGQDRASASWPKSLSVTAELTVGRVLRFVFWDGTTVTWHEWEIDRVSVASGTDDLLIRVALVPVQDRLRRVPVTLEDADGFVYFDVPAVQLTPAVILSDILLAAAPAWLVPGTVTKTDTEEVQFTKDTSLSGLVKLADHLCSDYEVTPNGTTEYQVHLRTRGAGATPVRIRTGKNLQALTREEGGRQVTRVVPGGAEGDDGGATLAWAYWTVLGVVGSLVELGPMHGSGSGPVGFDDQFNHANLGATWYLQRDDGSYTQITDAIASTQEIEVADATGISTGDRVRLVSSSTGRHVTMLDAPAEIADRGVHPEPYTSPWDDTVNILDNPLMLVYTNPTARPDGYTGTFGTWSKETGAGNWITGGQSAKLTGIFIGGVLLAKSEAWYIAKRKGTFSATLWLRITALGAGSTGGSLSFRFTRNGTPIGEAVLYRSPINVWRQLKLESLDLSADEGTVQTIGYELRAVPDNATMSVTAYIDSDQISPTLAARAITDGSNAARIWQTSNAWLDEQRVEPVQYTIRAVDLERAGIPRTAAITVGGDAIVDDEELGVAGLTARIVRRRRDLVHALLTEITASTARTPLPRRLATPTPLTIPFFEPVAVQAAIRDTRQAVQTLKAEITTSTETQVTITLSHSDLLGGSPTITRDQIGTSYVSGSGLGPYVYDKPAAKAGVGQVTFTATIPGRTDVVASVEVPEQVAIWRPVVRESISETDTAGTLTVGIEDDPDGRVSGVEFATQQGNGAMSAFALDSSPPFAQSVTFVEKQPSKIAYRVLGTDSDGMADQVLVENIVTLKPSVKPALPNVNADVTTKSGDVALRIEGDADTASIKYATSTSAMPADGTVDAASAVNGRSLATTLSAALAAIDSVLYVKARVFSSASGGGLGSEYAQLTIRRDTTQVTKTLRVQAHQMLPVSSAEDWASLNATIYHSVASGPGTVLNLIAPLPIPVGVLITALRMHSYVDASGVAAFTACQLNRVEGNDSETAIAFANRNSGAGWATTTVSGLSETASAGRHYMVTGALGVNTTGDPLNARLLWFEVDYVAHDYEETY